MTEIEAGDIKIRLAIIAEDIIDIARINRN